MNRSERNQQIVERLDGQIDRFIELAENHTVNTRDEQSLMLYQQLVNQVSDLCAVVDILSHEEE